MKNPSIFLLALLISLLLSACGKKEALPATSAPADSSVTPAAVVPMSEQAGPADLPPCPGFVSMESSQGDSKAGSSVLLSSQTVESLMDSYPTDLLAEGWIMESSIQQGAEYHLQFRQGNRFLHLQVGPADQPAGISRLQLAWGPGAGAEDVREAYEPDPEEAPSTNAEVSP
jgi:hypothetical protein